MQPQVTNPGRSATKSIGLVGLVNIGSAIVGVIQAVVVGGVFGTTSSIEVYFAAVVFYQGIVNLMQTGQITDVFTPLYHQLHQSNGEQTAFCFLSVLVNWMMIVAAVMSGAAYVFAEQVIPFTVPGFDDQRTAVCVMMFRQLVPLVGIQMLISLFSALLAAEKQFVAPEICRLCCVIVSLLIVLFLGPSWDAWIMVVALWATNLGTLTLFLILLFRLGYRHRFRLSDSDFSISHVVRSTPSISGYVLATQLYAVAFASGMSMLPQGSLAVFTYARRIASRINGVLLRPISVVFFNHYSSALAAGDAVVSSLARRALGITLTVASLAAVAVLAAGYPGLRTIWLSERFSDEQVFRTYLLLSAFCVLPFVSGLGTIFRKINMSHQLGGFQYSMLAVVQVFSAGLAWYLIPLVGMTGAVVVAVANPALLTGVSGILLRWRAADAFCGYRPAAVLRCVCLILVAALPSLLFHDSLHRALPELMSTRIHDLAVTLLLLVFSGMLAMTAGLLLKVDEIRLALQAALRMVRKR